MAQEENGLKELTDGVRTVLVPANTSVLFGLPCYGGNMQSHTSVTLDTMKDLLRSADIGFEDLRITNESLVQRARNTIASNFLEKTKRTHLFFLDADIYCPDPWALLQMIAEDRDILGAAYPKKEINWEAITQAARDGDYDHLTDWGVMYNANLPEGGTEYCHGCLRAEDVPTGFLLIKRCVFEKMRDELGSELSYHYDHDKAKLHYAFFDCWIEGCPDGTRAYLSEDWGFCRRAQKLGFQTWLDMRPKLGHIGQMLYMGPPMIEWWDRMGAGKLGRMIEQHAA